MPDAASAERVVADFRSWFRDSAAVWALASTGLSKLIDQLNSTPAPPENPNPNLFFGFGPPDDLRSPPHNSIRRNDLQRIRDEDEGTRWLAQQFIVSTYARWDEIVRPALAQALNLKSAEIKFQYFGDLRRFRHDVVHSKGVATKAYSASAELMTWFRVGEPIRFADEEVALLHTLAPWSGLSTLARDGVPEVT